MGSTGSSGAGRQAGGKKMHILFYSFFVDAGADLPEVYDVQQ